MIAVVVSLTLKPGLLSSFMPLMLENAGTSLRDETACIQFDVATDPDRPCDVFLYEKYETEAAFDLHLQSPHFKRFDTATADMIAHKTVSIYGRVHT